MKIGIVSDIHGNWEALKAVSYILESEKVEEVWCLGDIVGYGPDPSLCIEWVKKNCKLIVCGNHDKAIYDPSELVYFNPAAQTAINWTSEQLKESDIAFLKSLPLTINWEDYLLVHASPERPQDWIYIFSVWEAERAFECCEERIILVGHTHVPQAYELKEEMAEEAEFPVELKSNIRYLINPGSVGQPRDGDPRASFGILKDNVFELIRVEYDVRKTQTKMYERGLPEFLARRLATGI